MPRQAQGSNARNYDNSLPKFPLMLRDLETKGASDTNVIVYSAAQEAWIPGTVGGGTSAYSLGVAATDTALTGTTLTLSAAQKFTTGDISQTTLVGTATFGTGSNVGTTGLTAALAAAASLYATLIALPGTAITTPGTLWADNYGYGVGVFVPGVYTTASAITMTASKSITLSGVGDYVFVSTGGAITFGASDTITLTNGAVASRVYWVSSAGITTGATDTLKGNFMAGADIVIGSTNNIEGRLLAVGATTIDGTATNIYQPIA